MQKIYKAVKKHNVIGFDLDDTLAIRWEGQWVEGATELLQSLAAQGKQVVIATNQGGVACRLAGWGDYYPTGGDVVSRLQALEAESPVEVEIEWRASIFYPDAVEESKLHAIAEEMEELGAQSGLDLRVYPGAGARKPEPKMLQNLDVFVGDSDSDRLAAEAAGISIIQV